jgi:hypothetical protein
MMQTINTTWQKYPNTKRHTFRAAKRITVVSPVLSNLSLTKGEYGPNGHHPPKSLAMMPVPRRIPFGYSAPARLPAALWPGAWFIFAVSQEGNERILMSVGTIKRLTARTASLALAAICCRAALAAAPELPPSAIAADTFVVVHMNVAKVDPASVEASAKALLGQQAAMAASGLDKYKAKYAEYTSTGAEAVTFVMSGDPDQEKKPEPIIYVKLKPGADFDAAAKKVRDEQAKEAKGQDMEISHQGDFMVLHTKATALPTGGSADRAKSFGEVLGSADQAVSVAFIPTDKIRSKMKEDIKNNKDQPAWAQTMAPLLADSKWLMVGAQLGDSPTIGLTLQAADDAGAKGIADSITQGGQQLKAQADQMKQGGPQFAGMATAMGGLADALKPTQNGSKVSLNIDGKAIAPAVANFLPFMMMGAGGGAPAPAQRNPGN